MCNRDCLIYLDESNISSLLPECLTAHVESVLADDTSVLALAGYDTVGVSMSLGSDEIRRG